MILSYILVASKAPYIFWGSVLVLFIIAWGIAGQNDDYDDWKNNNDH